MAPESLIDIGPLDRTSGQCLGIVDDVGQGVTVVRVPGNALACSTNWPPGAGPVVGDDGGFDAELVRRGCLALADAFDFRGMKGIELPAALALLLRADLSGPPERKGECLLEDLATFNLAADVADDPAEPAAQDAQLPLMPLELLASA